jgi:hypothetical protein
LRVAAFICLPVWAFACGCSVRGVTQMETLAPAPTHVWLALCPVLCVPRPPPQAPPPRPAWAARVPCVPSAPRCCPRPPWWPGTPPALGWPCASPPVCTCTVWWEREKPGRPRARVPALVDQGMQVAMAPCWSPCALCQPVHPQACCGSVAPCLWPRQGTSSRCFLPPPPRPRTPSWPTFLLPWGCTVSWEGGVEEGCRRRHLTAWQGYWQGGGEGGACAGRGWVIVVV